MPLWQRISEEEEEKQRASEEARLRLDELAQEISAAWPEGVAAVEAIREQRRELSTVIANRPLLGRRC